MQVVDSLQLGGMESVAVNFANLLPQRGVRSFLCSTRCGGPLEKRLSNSAEYLDLRRRALIDFAALRRFVRCLNNNRIRILHAHGSALFFSSLASLFVPKLKVIWHDHFGRYATEERLACVFRLATSR